MVMEDQIESTVDGLSEPVGAAAFFAEWRENADGRRLPGEEGGCTVFAIQFWDGCHYFGVTDMSILDAVDDLVASPFLARLYAKFRGSNGCDHVGTPPLVAGVGGFFTIHGKR